MLPILLFVLSAFPDYQQASKQYLTAKNQYSQYRTSSTRQEAVNKTLTLLLSRNRLILEYLHSLGEKSMDEELTLWEQNIKNSDTVAEVNKAALDWESKLERITKLANQAKLVILKNNLKVLQDNLTNIGTTDKMTTGNAKLYTEKLRLAETKRNLVVFDTNYWSYENLLGYLKESRDALSSASQILYEATTRP
ncbi:MAG: hypothetical protein Q8L51_01580 [Candidatus Amesbacteria bacterium]|nr:hypothetical protein [Candidatus Amesbacteria bacterium]